MNASEEEDVRGMDDALERARERGGRDTFNVLDAKPEPSMGDAMDRARAGGGRDVFGVLGKPAPEKSTAHIAEAVAQLTPPEEKKPPAGPALGPVEPPPATPPDVAPPPEAPPEQPFQSNDFPKPPGPEGPDPKRLAAIEAIKRLADFNPAQTPPGLDDGAIANAQASDKAQTKRNDLSRSFMDLAYRKPFAPTAPSDAADLVQRRQLAEGSANRTDQRALSSQEALVKALTSDEKPNDPARAAFWDAERTKWTNDDARATAAAKAKEDATKKTNDETAGSLENGRQLLLADPRAKAFGLTPESVAKLDRKGLEDALRQLETMPKGKGAGAGAGGPAKAVKTLDDVPDPSDRAKVAGLLDHSLGAGDMGSRKDQGRLIGMAAQIAQARGEHFDSTLHGTYQHVAQQTATDAQIGFATNATKHFQRALETMPANFDSQALNRIINAVRTGSGGAGLSEYESDIAVGAGEMAKGLAENDAHGKEALKALLEPGQSPEQIRKHLTELIYLQKENLDTKRQKFQSAAPKGTEVPEMLRDQTKPPPAPLGKTNVREKSTKRVIPMPSAEALRLVHGNPNYEVAD